ncbi:MAG: dihydrofolate reductase family protein [Dehalococcoidia bacterium]
MRKLIESTFVSLDGVISAPQEWSPPYWDEEHAAYARDLFFAADAMLLGRATYEGFAAAWPSRTGDEFSDRFNSVPKYVASRTLVEPLEWNATLIKGDVAEEIAKLKQQPGQNIVKYGTGELDRTLMEHNLVDEFHFWVFPVAAGKGDRLFDGIGTTHLKLIDTTRFASGIVVLTYAPK